MFRRHCAYFFALLNLEVRQFFFTRNLSFPYFTLTWNDVWSNIFQIEFILKNKNSFTNDECYRIRIKK